MFSSRLWQLFLDSFPKILLPGLTATIPLTIISFSLALVIAVVAALVQFANIQGLKQIARFYIWIFRGTPAFGTAVRRVLRSVQSRHRSGSVSRCSHRLFFK